MNYVKNILVVGFLLFSINFTHSFEKPTNLGRYSEIIKSFDINAKKFTSGFVVQVQDIEVIKTRKELLKKDLESKKITYATTWMPLLYKILGVGFGLESIRRLLSGGLLIADSTIGLSNDVYLNLKYPITALSYMNYPISYPISKAGAFVNEGVFKKIKSLYANNTGTIDDMLKYYAAQRNYLASYSFGISLGAGILTKYFFNKAASYKNEIANIEQEIKIDDAMIDVLSRNGSL